LFGSKDLASPRTLTEAHGYEYKICLSGSPSQLATDVSNLLAQGWVVHGSPFVELKFSQSAQGTQITDNIFCQAMVRFSNKPAIVPRSSTAATAQSIAQRRAPSRPPRPSTLSGVISLLALLVVGYLTADTILFRSGFYVRFLEPESFTGSFERTFKIEKDRAPSGKKEVLVVGSSRLAEGFFTKLANQYKPEDGYRFFNCSVPSSGSRTFFYMIRDLDPKRNRYAAIAVPIDDFEDPDDNENPADRAMEVRLVVNRLRLSDILPYTLSYPRWASRREVFRSALLKGTVYQSDIADFIEHPKERLERVRIFKENNGGWSYDYGGLERSLAGLSVDWANHHATFPASLNPDEQRFIEGVFFHTAPQKGNMRAFEVRWLGSLIKLYEGSKTKIILFQAPRGPVHRPAPHLAWTSIDELRKYPSVLVIDGHRFEFLERPELFADHVHLNSEGRKQFTPLLVDAIKESLH
jgi:hypothetical protein